MSETAPAAPLLRTPLIDFHRAHGAHLVPFAGWEMPLYYSSIVAEHTAVRTDVGLFDVGHMGILTVHGTSADGLLSRRTTANVRQLLTGQVRYTFFLESAGRIVDDLLITRLDVDDRPERQYLTVPNAGRAAEIQLLLEQHRHPDTTVSRWNDIATILAIQGPKSRSLLEQTMGWSLGDLKFYTGRFFPADPRPGTAREGRSGGSIPKDLGHEIFVSRTGYTGELGYELFVRRERAAALAETFALAGATPCGLGARDTLRLEKGYLLSGQEFYRDRTPIEAGQEKFVEFDHPFVGRPTLEKQVAEGPKERLAGLRALETGAIPRHGTPILHDGTPVAVATSGGLSPTLQVGIALGYLPRALTEPGTHMELDVRGRHTAAEVVRLPFLPATAPTPSPR
jgi:aminomethyltransferase